MGVAGLVNMSMLVIAASLFHDKGLTGVDTIEGAHAQFGALAGGGAALAFAVALLASGFASSSVGTQAGQVVMQGFISRTIPLVAAPGGHDDAGADRARDRRRPVARARPQPGGAELRHPVRARAAGAAHAPARRHGRRSSTARLTTVVAALVAALIIALNVFLLFADASAGAEYAPAHAARRHVLAGRRRRCPTTGPTSSSTCGSTTEARYIDAAVYLVTCNAQPYSQHDWHWRLLVAHRFGHAAAAPAVHAALKLLDDAGIAGELAVREVRSGRVEVVQMWGRPESVRQEFRRTRSQ